MGELTTRNEDRRRNPRFHCGGEAKIVLLPSDGILFPGRVLDLSLGGCCIETVPPFPCGGKAEVLLHVNTSSFRAVGEVRGMRDGMKICMEFLRLSARGRDLLAELIAQLARVRATMNALKRAGLNNNQGETDPELVRRYLRHSLREVLLSEHLLVPAAGIVAAAPVESAVALTRPASIVNGRQEPRPVDLYI